MRNIIFKAATVAVLFGASATQVLANGWEVWTEKQGADRLTIVASFAGDGLVEEAQLDLNLKGSFEVLDTQVLQKGSVCFAHPESNTIRAVPPSGAGKALKSASTDTCMFTVRITSLKGWSPTEVVGVSLNECASSVKGLVPCEASIRMVK